MASYGISSFCASLAVVFVTMTGCVVHDSDVDATDSEVNQPVGTAPIVKADGEPCDEHAECSSGVCVPTLPAQVSPRGVCWGEDYQGCIWVLVFDTWAEDACTDFGMTVALCAPTPTPEMNERCKKPYGQVGGEYPYNYMCCETTFLE